MLENVFFVISSVFLVIFQVGEIAFFIVVAILGLAVVIKVVKNKKKAKNNPPSWKFLEIHSKLLYWNKWLCLMHIEYEEFDTIEDIFLYMASAAPPMKNTMPINSYKGYVFSFIPLSPSTGDVYLLIYTKGKLDGKILEFDINTQSYRKVSSIERADKTYFIVLTPKRNTIADVALEKL